MDTEHLNSEHPIWAKLTIKYHDAASTQEEYICREIIAQTVQSDFAIFKSAEAQSETALKYYYVAEHTSPREDAEESASSMDDEINEGEINEGEINKDEIYPEQLRATLPKDINLDFTKVKEIEYELVTREESAPYLAPPGH